MLAAVLWIHSEDNLVTLHVYSIQTKWVFYNISNSNDFSHLLYLYGKIIVIIIIVRGLTEFLMLHWP